VPAIKAKTLASSQAIACRGMNKLR